MRLISQDGNVDIPYEQAHILCNMEYVMARVGNYEYTLGKYSDKSKALKVMEMLRNAYTDFKILNSCSVGMADLQPTFLRIVSEKIPKALVPYFRFPTDEEIEV